MKISIIIPVYNIELYINRCIESVVNQTYKNIQVIIIDDGSTDTTPELCDMWKAKDSRIEVIHQENSGVSSARNAGLDVAKGDFIAFVDADDWIVKDMYELMLKKILKENTDIVFSGYTNVYENGQVSKIEPRFEGVKTKEDAMVSCLVRDGYFVSVWNKLFKREVCIDRNTKKMIRFKKYSWGEDEVWLFDVLNNCDRVSLLPSSLYFWYIRSGSACRKEGLTLDRVGLREVGEHVCEIAKHTGEKITEQAIINQFINIYNLLLLAYIYDDSKLLIGFKNDIKKYFIAWFFSSESLLGKFKKILILFLVVIKFPKKYIQKMNKWSGEK